MFDMSYFINCSSDTVDSCKTPAVIPKKKLKLFDISLRCDLTITFQSLTCSVMMLLR